MIDPRHPDLSTATGPSVFMNIDEAKGFPASITLGY